MSVFDVIFNRAEKFSSDANVQTSPDAKSTVVAPLHQADIARVEAESPEDAEAVVRVAYNASTSDVNVHDVTPVEPEVETETEAVDEAPVDEKPADTAPAPTTQDPVPAETDKTEPVV